MLRTTHKVIFKNSIDMSSVPSGSVDLVVTSPPYPMIKMWDEMFERLNPAIANALNKEQGMLSFELMNRQLDQVWDEVYRVLRNGGIACINIGDATRKINDNFMLYSNHSRILTYMLEKGFVALPEILWRKQTNAPNKFMGSGTLPAGAYVTLEHEYILILRKGRLRDFATDDEKQNRRESSIFWEERNVWYSDVWMDIKGTVQKLKNKETGKRSAAYPFELPSRLINMFSVRGDTVLDPFLGIGTTIYAAVAACRNSIGFEIDTDFREIIFSKTDTSIDFSNKHIENRINKHIDFVKERFKTKGKFKYQNKHYGFPVVSRQERELFLSGLVSINKTGSNSFETVYSDKPQKEFCKNWENYII